MFMSIKNILYTILCVNLVLTFGAGTFLFSNAKLINNATSQSSLSYQNQKCKVDFRVGDWTEICNIKKFNPKDGILKGLKIEVLAQTRSNIQLENLNIIETKAKVSSKSNLVLKDQSGLNLLSMDIAEDHNYNLKKYDQTQDFKGESGVSDLNIYSGVVSKNIDLSDPQIVNKFIGTEGDNSTKIEISSDIAFASFNNIASILTAETEVQSITLYYAYEQGDLSISQTQDKDKYNVGDKINYSYIVKNNDVNPTSGLITVKVNIGPSNKYISNSNPDWKCLAMDTSVLSCTSNIILESGKTSIFTLAVEIADTVSQKVDNTAQVMYYTGEYDYKNNNSQSTAITVVQTALPTPTNEPVSYNCDLGSIVPKTSYTIQLRTVNCLKGTDKDGDNTISNIIIETLPLAESGVLTYNNLPIVKGTKIPLSEINKIVLVTTDNCKMENEFNYSVEDNTGLKDLTPSKVAWKCGIGGYDQDLELIKYTQGDMKELSLGRYVFRIKNKSNNTWKGKIQLTDMLPAGLNLVWITTPNGWVCNGINSRNLDCIANPDYALEPGQEVFVESQVWIDPIENRLVKNQACIKTFLENENPANNCGFVESYIKGMDSVSVDIKTDTVPVPPSATNPTTPTNVKSVVIPMLKPIVKDNNMLPRTGGFALATIILINIGLIVGMLIFKKFSDRKEIK